MTPEKIRQKARELHTKTRRKLLVTLTVPPVIALFYAFALKQFPTLHEVLHPLFGADKNAVASLRDHSDQSTLDSQ